MRTKLLTEVPALLEEGFKKDLDALAALDDQLFEKVVAWAVGRETIRDLMNRGLLADFATNTGLDLESIESSMRSVVWLALTASKFKASLPDVVDDLVEAKIIRSHGLAARMKRVGEHISRLAAESLRRTPPALPLKYIRSISTRCIFVADIPVSFSIATDKPESYAPNVSAMHPIVSLKLKFGDDTDIGIALDLEDIGILRSWLALAESEIRTVAKLLPENLVILNPGA